MRAFVKFLCILIVTIASFASLVLGYIFNIKYDNLQKSNVELQNEVDSLKKANSYLKEQIYELEIKK